MSVPTTPNYGLKKPDGTEKMTPAQFNYNADIIDAELFKRRVITGTTAPTTSTVGKVGQSYLNTIDFKKYTCTAISGSVYSWSPDAPEQTYLKLMDVTTTANAAQVDLDVSGIDLTKYAAIRMVAAVKVTPLGTAMTLMLKINNGSTYTRHRNENDLYNRNYAAYVYVNTMDEYFSNFDMEISGIPDGISSGYYPQFVIHGFDHYGGNNNFRAWSFDGAVPLEANSRISTINFVADNSSVSIKAGSKFKIYGVRK